MQYKLVEQSRDFNIDNAAKGYLPQISVTGLATYHTDMLKSSNITKTLDTKNSLYGGMVQISENIYDGGAISARKSIAKADANAGATAPAVWAESAWGYYGLVASGVSAAERMKSWGAV